MARTFHIDEFRSWQAGPNTPIKYSIQAILDCTEVSHTQTDATFSLTGKIVVNNYPNNSQNSFAASDFAVLTLGGYDPANYNFTSGTYYYQAALPTVPNAPQEYLNALRFEFRGDTYRADGANKVSLWINGNGLVLDKASSEGTWEFGINQTFTIPIPTLGEAEVLIYNHSGAGNAYDYNWLQRVAWIHWYDLAYTYTLYYEAPEAAGGIPSPQSYTTLEDKVGFQVSPNAPWRSGYGFAGWADTPGGEAIYKPGESWVEFGNPIFAKTIYGVWDQQYTYQLRYEAPGATNVPPTQSYTGTELKAGFRVSSQIPEIEGGEWLGWADSPGGTPRYQGGEWIELEYPNTVKTLYGGFQFDYRPGETWSGSSWMSHDRASGWAGVWDGSKFAETRTQGGDGSTSGDPPYIYNGSAWANQRKIGVE